MQNKEVATIDSIAITREEWIEFFVTLWQKAKVCIIEESDNLNNTEFNLMQPNLKLIDALIGNLASKDKIDIENLEKNLDTLVGFLSINGLMDSTAFLTSMVEQLKSIPPPIKNLIELPIDIKTEEPINNPLALPIEIITDEIAPYLSRKAIRSFALTCQFFAGNQKLRDMFVKLKSIKLISVGGNHSFFVDQEDQLYGFGNNKNDQLGLGLLLRGIVNTPQPLLPAEEIGQISCGHNFSLILCKNKNLYSFGCNQFGQLGQGFDTVLRLMSISEITPKLLILPDNEKALEIAAGHEHAFIITEKGSLFAFGRNDVGQLGLGNSEHCYYPKRVGLPNREIVHKVHTSAYSDSNLIVCKSGAMYVCGWNEYGQLGLGNRNNRPILQPLRIPNGQKPKEVALGAAHTLILFENGELFVFGANMFGQLGLGDKINRFTPQPLILPNSERAKRLKAGGAHTVIECESGKVLVFGCNKLFQLGLGTTTNQLTPQYLVLSEERKIENIAVGWEHNFILYRDGTIDCFGRNEEGQLGLGHRDNQPYPIMAKRKEEEDNCLIM